MNSAIPTNSNQAPGRRSSRQGAASGRVRFDISRITLHGFTRADQTRFTRALEKSLTTLGSQLNVCDASTPLLQNIDHLDAGLLQSGASPEEAARRVVMQIHAALTPREEGGRHV